jgi:hypothetical protein
MTTSPPLTRRRDAALRYALIWLELFVAVGAVYGAIMLMTDSWHLPAQDLRPLPLHSWVLPGLALFALITVPMSVAAIGVYWDTRRAGQLSIGAGLGLVGWILLQLLVIGPQMWLQAFMLVCGLAIAALGWIWHARRRS